MIIIYKNKSINTIYSTLNEGVTGLTSGLTYLFNIKSDETLVEHTYNLTDKSEYYTRWQEFDITSAVTYNLSEGEYIYNFIYQNTILEIGKLKIIDISNLNTEYTGDDNKRIVYEN
jgi:hypothetical protein